MNCIFWYYYDALFITKSVKFKTKGSWKKIIFLSGHFSSNLKINETAAFIEEAQIESSFNISSYCSKVSKSQMYNPITKKCFKIAFDNIIVGKTLLSKLFTIFLVAFYS